MISGVRGEGPGGDQLLEGRDRGSEQATGRVGGTGPCRRGLGKHSSTHKPCPPKSTLTGPKACSQEQTLQTLWEEEGSATQHLTCLPPQRSGVQGPSGGCRAHPLGTQGWHPAARPGPRSWLCCFPTGGPGRLLTSSGPQVPHRGEGLRSQQAVSAWRWATRGPVQACCPLIPRHRAVSPPEL